MKVGFNFNPRIKETFEHNTVITYVLDFEFRWSYYVPEGWTWRSGLQQQRFSIVGMLLLSLVGVRMEKIDSGWCVTMAILTDMWHTTGNQLGTCLRACPEKLVESVGVSSWRGRLTRKVLDMAENMMLVSCLGLLTLNPKRFAMPKKHFIDIPEGPKGAKCFLKGVNSPSLTV